MFFPAPPLAFGMEYIYLGQTGRNLKKRLEEHKSLTNNMYNTEISTYCIEGNHFVNLINVELLLSEKMSKNM